MRSRVGDAKQVVSEVTGQLARLAEAQLTDARRMVTNAPKPWPVAGSDHRSAPDAGAGA
jgi:hypothetical protein